MSNEINYHPLTAEYYQQVIDLGNSVHGDGYLDSNKIVLWTNKGISQINGETVNTNFVALHQDKVVGFRITYSAKQWPIDQWCSPSLWQVPQEQCCYFKCNTVNEQYRGKGIGKKLLMLAIEAAKKQGAVAGISHLWKQSPNNSAVKYFTHCGGKHIASHVGKWNEESKQGYCCVICGYDCQCEAAEMIIYFD
ncbi:GNAT family N-acetyltransferase [Litorilituus lipolyticus]|uniref:GNAT family N-acetyltransferase n=1 Tax=Litorilituus lipolyticus TaxID=2491017 RepID=A0A502KTL5_9GAMM|nr:GNAT family N-acetyltransferase [Litorilituus lipolyticus]TPH15030.1 GNAT family N-acetyltransferase [Litorilituus lipolyticus]